jgi:hypothetical protein
LLFIEAFCLRLEAADRLFPVKPKMDGISTHETESVDPAREVVIPPRLERFEIGDTNAQRCGYPINISTKALARFAQQLADGVPPTGRRICCRLGRCSHLCLGLL